MLKYLSQFVNSNRNNSINKLATLQPTAISHFNWFARYHAENAQTKPFFSSANEDVSGVHSKV